ncbi:alpha/beta hydrolase [Colwellia sp. MEBiC06753]
MIKKILIAIVVLSITAIAGVAVWMSIPFPYSQLKIEQSLNSDDLVKVEQNNWLSFAPKNRKAKVGVIFYPGGKTPAQVFAPLLKSIAGQGYIAVSVPMPLNTAFLGINKANAVMAEYPDIQHWVIAGHSLGGVAAVEYAKDNNDKLAGLMLLASYPASDISALTLKVLSVSGSADQQSTPDKIANTKAMLPPRAEFVEIHCGDHYQFGAYDPALSKESACIGYQQQQAQLLSIIIEFLAGF